MNDTSKLLQSGREASVAAFDAEIEAWESKLSHAIKQRDALKQRFDSVHTPDSFRGQERGQLQALCDAVTHREAVIALLKEKRAEAAKARPARLKEAEAAMQERDQLAAEVAESYPAMVLAIVNLFERIEVNNARLLKCAAIGEAEVTTVNAWNAARGKDEPLTVSGESAAPRVFFQDLDGKTVFKTPERTMVPVESLPERIRVTNNSDKPAWFAPYGPMGTRIGVEPHETKVIPVSPGVHGNPALVATLEA